MEYLFTNKVTEGTVDVNDYNDCHIKRPSGLHIPMFTAFTAIMPMEKKNRPFIFL